MALTEDNSLCYFVFTFFLLFSEVLHDNDSQDTKNAFMLL